MHLQYFLITRNPDFLFITETWLSSKILNSELIGNLPYKIFRSDRKGRRGGGVCCIVKDTVNVIPVSLSSCIRSDLLCLESSDANGAFIFRIILVYRPPNSTSDDDDALLECLIELGLSCNHVIVLGDFNIDFSRDEHHSSNIKKFVEFFKMYGLSQQVPVATRGVSILDIVLASAPILKNISVLPPFATSDHNIVSFHIMCSYDKQHKIPLPNFNKANYSALSNFFNCVDWWDILRNYTDLDDLYKRFCRVVYAGLSNHVPFHSIEVLNQSCFPKHITNLMSQKTRLFNSLANPLLDSRYKKVNLELDRHLRKFFAYRERRALSSTKRNVIFSLVKQKIKGIGKLPVLLDESGNRYVTDVQKAEVLAKYFSSVFISDSATCTPTIDGCYSTNVLSEIVLETSEVLRIMKALKGSNSVSFDGIPQIVYKRCALSLHKPLTMILNSSLLFSEVPEMWKKSIITAIPKVANANLVSSYRPISITPTPIKILEKLIRDKIVNWLGKRKVIPPEQHGFTSGASTVTQLADCVFDWNCALNEGHSVDVIYFDLSKAFDKVCHLKLLHKLNHIGIRGTLLNWFRSYLENRSMHVKVENSFSKSYPCTSGVPQGGVLSPLLFLIYTYDLPSKLKTHPSVKVQLYADDIKVYGIYNHHNNTEIRYALSQSIKRMMEWASVWQIPVNISKSLVLHIGKDASVSYMYKDILFKTVTEVRDLGIYIDRQLNFKSHVDRIAKKAFSTLFCILRNVQCNEPFILIKLYKSYILPILEYGSQIWSPFTRKMLTKLEKVQQVFTKVLIWRCSSPAVPSSMPSYRERLNLFCLKSLLYRRTLFDVTFCFKVLKGKLKIKPSKYWIFRPCNGRVGRLSIQLSAVRRIRRMHMLDSLFYRGARWLQMLPRDILESSNISVFKKRLKQRDFLSDLQIADF